MVVLSQHTFVYRANVIFIMISASYGTGDVSLKNNIFFVQKAAVETRRLSYLLCPGVAVDATIGGGFGIVQLEDLLDSLLGGCDATGVLAHKNVREGLGERDFFLLYYLFVTDDAYRGSGADKADEIHVKLLHGVDLDDVLFAQLEAIYVFQHSYGAIQGVQAQHLVQDHGLAGRNVVDDNAVFDAIDSHTSISNNFRISAMRTYLP